MNLTENNNTQSHHLNSEYPKDNISNTTNSAFGHTDGLNGTTTTTGNYGALNNDNLSLSDNRITGNEDADLSNNPTTATTNHHNLNSKLSPTNHHINLDSTTNSNQHNKSNSFTTTGDNRTNLNINLDNNNHNSDLNGIPSTINHHDNLNSNSTTSNQKNLNSNLVTADNHNNLNNIGATSNTHGNLNSISNTAGHHDNLNNNGVTSNNFKPIPEDITNEEFKNQPFEHNNPALNNTISDKFHNNSTEDHHLNNGVRDTNYPVNSNGDLDNKHHVSITGTNNVNDDEHKSHPHIHTGEKKLTGLAATPMPGIIDTHYPDASKVQHDSTHNKHGHTLKHEKDSHDLRHDSHAHGIHQESHNSKVKHSVIPSAAIAGTGTAVSSVNPLIASSNVPNPESDTTKVHDNKLHNTTVHDNKAHDAKLHGTKDGALNDNGKCNIDDIATNDPIHVGTKPDDVAKANPLNNNVNLDHKETSVLRTENKVTNTKDHSAIGNKDHHVDGHDPNDKRNSGGHTDKLKGKAKVLLGKLLHKEELKHEGENLILQGELKLESKKH
ncbi:hypothetical protein K502DRAFT_323479 [Neoconidiobolus thromboides FSU 785]|nr:hypothetical protein K502DRAFT_323479 [Neoconidiobolus thromboides FSU 785]